MDPITIGLIIAGLLSAGAIIALLTWDQVDSFVTSHAVNQGTAKLIQKRLESGEFVVVAGVSGSNGTKLKERTWQAKAIDAELGRRFGGRDEITIKT